MVGLRTLVYEHPISSYLTPGLHLLPHGNVVWNHQYNVHLGNIYDYKKFLFGLSAHIPSNNHQVILASLQPEPEIWLDLG